MVDFLWAFINSKIENPLNSIQNFYRRPFIFAERKGFEPSIHFWCIHTFQACAFDHSATSLV